MGSKFNENPIGPAFFFRKIYIKSPSSKPIKKAISKENLALIIGLINGDGHLQVKETKGTVSFYSKNKKDIDRVIKMFTSYFDVKPLLYQDNRLGDKRYKLFFASKSLSYFLKDSGAAVGNKTNLPYVLPSWIVKGNNKIKSSYLRGIYDCEGSIYSQKDGRMRITLTQYRREDLKQYAVNYFNQMKDMLFSFDIKSSPIKIDKGNERKDGTRTICFRVIIEKSSFSNFYKCLDFFDSRKQKLLCESLKP